MTLLIIAAQWVLETLNAGYIALNSGIGWGIGGKLGEALAENLWASITGWFGAAV